MDVFQIGLMALDYAAVTVFAATGALAAARGRHDIVTFAFFAAVTGVGGGTLRDLLIGAPVFWVERPDYLAWCLGAALAVWVLGPRRFSERLLVWLDAVGMASYAVVGAAKALALGMGPVPAIVMGVMTATFGGIIRDVLAREPSILLRREIYITAALAGAAAFVILMSLGVRPMAAGLAGFAVGMALRGGAIAFGWALPAFAKGAEGRANPES